MLTLNTALLRSARRHSPAQCATGPVLELLKQIFDLTLNVLRYQSSAKFPPNMARKNLGLVKNPLYGETYLPRPSRRSRCI